MFCRVSPAGFLFVISVCGSLIEDSLNFCTRCLVNQGKYHCCNQAACEARDDFVDTGVAHECQPQHVYNGTGYNTGNSTLIGEASPEQGQDDGRSESRTEAGPCVFYQVHDCLRTFCLRGCDKETDNGYNQHHDTSNPQDFLFGSILTQDWLIDVRSEGAGSNQQLGVRGRHGCCNDGCHQNTCDKCREQLSGKYDEHGLLCTDGQQLFCQQHSAEVSNQAGCTQGKNDPDDGNGCTLLHHGRLFDGHETYQDVRHTEVTKTPAQTTDDILPAGCEQTGTKYTLCHLAGRPVGVAVYGFQCRSVQVLCQYDDDWNCQNCNEHQDALKEVGPAYGLKSAEEGAGQHGDGENNHGSLGAQRREYGGKHGCPCYEAGCNIYGKAGEEDNRADNLQSVTLRRKTVA